MASDVRDVAEEKGAAIPYRMLLTKMSPLRTRVTDFVYQELARHKLPIFRTVLVERVAYKEMFLTGVPPSATDKGRGRGRSSGAGNRDGRDCERGARQSRRAESSGVGDMTVNKQIKPAFQSVELDPMDLRLEAKAVEKGIPTLVTTRPVTDKLPLAPSQAALTNAAPRNLGRAGASDQSTPRARMKTLNIEVPDYALDRDQDACG